MWVRSVWAVAFIFGAALVGCGGSSESDASSGGGAGKDAGSGGTGGSGGAAGSGGSAGSATGGSSATGGAAGAVSFGHCGDPPPPGAAAPPAPPKYSGGTCPTLAAGSNTIATAGGDRKLVLVLPKDLKADEHPPVIFLWHWLGGDAQDFVDKGEIQAAADSQRFIAVAPEKKGDVLFVWPATALDSQARADEELVFFDDMYSCVDAQFGIDRNCVSSAGVSAGALWTDQLAHLRSEVLASFLSLSGGVGGLAIKPWAPAARKLPGLVLWGGDTDACVVGPVSLPFKDISANLENELTKDGHFFVECVHNCGHSEPPLTGQTSKFQGLWDFVLDHPYWVPAGKSSYQTGGLPKTLPPWCGIGKGSATPPTTTCTNPSQC